MTGVRLEVEVHIVTGAVTSVQNVVRSVNRAGLAVHDIVLEPRYDLAKRRYGCFATAFKRRPPLKLSQALGDHAGEVNSVTPLAVRTRRHPHPLFREYFRWISSISARTVRAGMPSSISVYFCKSAAVNFFRISAYRLLRSSSSFFPGRRLLSSRRFAMRVLLIPIPVPVYRTGPMLVNDILRIFQSSAYPTSGRIRRHPIAPRRSSKSARIVSSVYVPIMAPPLPAKWAVAPHWRATSTISTCRGGSL